MDTRSLMMTVLLEHACPAQENWYVIDVHCVRFTIRAVKINGDWEILDYKKEDI